MKTMTCKQLGGACDKEFAATTFEEIGELAKQHGIEMYQQGDEAHIKAMNDMREKMNDPKAMQEWMADVRNKFDSLPESN